MTAVRQIYPVSFIMGEILDSQYVSTYSVADYSSRTASYLNTLGSYVDVWEVGNEVNGEWLGSTPDGVAKMYDAYMQVKQRGWKTALTLYYNGPLDEGSASCWASADHQMFNWAQANIPSEMKQHLDYVLVSYYEDDCNGIQPNWTSVFQQLAQMFPYSYIGLARTAQR